MTAGDDQQRRPTSVKSSILRTFSHALLVSLVFLTVADELLRFAKVHLRGLPDGGG